MTYFLRGVFICGVAFATTVPLCAQSSVRVEHVAVVGAGQAVEVEIQSSGPITPQSQMIAGPDRIIATPTATEQPR